MGLSKEKRKFIFIEITVSIRRARNSSEGNKEVDAVQLAQCLTASLQGLCFEKRVKHGEMQLLRIENKVLKDCTSELYSGK